MSKYSIILPVRNGGNYLKECVHSILAQEYSDFNLIILDNNSNDGTSEWIESLKESRIIVYRSEESLGIENNWGRIRQVIKNEFITLIGHDDILLPGYLREMNELINKHPDASLYQAHYEFIDATGKFTGYCKPMDEIQYGHEFLACQLARTMDSMGTGYMMRSKDYDFLGGMPIHYPNLIFADYELWTRLSLISYKATSPKVCFKYRIHQSTSKLTNGDKYQQAFGNYIHFLADAAHKHPQVKAVIDKYGKEMLMYFCESLSHRLLKTPMSERKIRVREFIDKCRAYASIIIPGQGFEPAEKFRIGIAEKIDSNVLARSLFTLFKKIAS